jgi:hypothetical protein
VCIVVHIPAGTLEVQAGSGERPLQHPAANGAFKLRLGAEILDLFKTVTTLGAAIRIQRQGLYLFSR